jgi:hypothetical protein
VRAWERLPVNAGFLHSCPPGQDKDKYTVSYHPVCLGASWHCVPSSHQHACGEQTQPGHLTFLQPGSLLEMDLDLNLGLPLPGPWQTGVHLPCGSAPVVCCSLRK